MAQQEMLNKIYIIVDGRVAGLAESITIDQKFNKGPFLDIYELYNLKGEIKDVTFLNNQEFNEIFDAEMCQPPYSIAYSGGGYHWRALNQKRKFDIDIKTNKSITEVRNAIITSITSPITINQNYYTDSIKFRANCCTIIHNQTAKTCSFCQKFETEVSAIFEENGEYICDECVLQCVETMRDKDPLWFYDNIQSIPDVCKRKILNAKQ